MSIRRIPLKQWKTEEDNGFVQLIGKAAKVAIEPAKGGMNEVATELLVSLAEKWK
jgi:hypothetical protein